jgi:hypothetical protein
MPRPVFLLISQSPTQTKLFNYLFRKNFNPPPYSNFKGIAEEFDQKNQKMTGDDRRRFCTHPKCVNLNNGPHHLISLRNKKGVGRAGKRYSVPVSKCPRGDGMFHYIFKPLP